MTARAAGGDGRSATGPWFRRGPGRDPELLCRPVPEPPTEREQEGRASLNDTDLEIFRHKMDSTVDEARSVFEKLAMCETLLIGDVGTSIFTVQGDMAACSTGIYFHSLLNYGPIKYVMKYYKDDPTVGLRDGDIFFFNETLAGGIHPFDMWVFMPIFAGEELIAWACAGGHQGESGSKDPGGFSPTAVTRYDEGLHVPALKIGEAFRIKTDHLDFLANSVRNPRQLAMDIKTRVAVCMRMRERVLREAEKRGVAFVVAALRELIARSGAMARERLRSFNDGTYRAVVFVDTIGNDDGLLRMPVAFHKRGDRLTIDFSGCSPEHGKGPFQLYWHIVRATTAVYLFTYVFEGLPLNMGLYETVDVVIPAGTFLNVSEEVAHGASSFTGRICVQAMHQAGARMIFDSPIHHLASAPFAANFLWYLYGGKDQYGYPMAGGPGGINAAGQGARHDLDGEHTCGFFWAPEVDLLSVEEHEAKFPWLYLSRNRFDTNLHGFGRFRGGTGMAEIFTPHNVPRLRQHSLSHADRFTVNYGLFGGYAAPTNPRFVVRNTNLKDMMARNDPRLPWSLYELANGRALEGDYRVERGNQASQIFTDRDLFVMFVGSGGGYGDVLEREPEMVMQDLREALITPRVAREIYLVTFDEATLEVDKAETERRRAAERQARIRRGVPYERFVAEWAKRRPPEAALKYYGEWPEPKPAVAPSMV